MVDQAYKTGDASVDMKNGAKDMAHDVKNNVKDAFHEAKAGVNERRAEDAAADREHQVAQQTGSTDAAMRAQQHENRRTRSPRASWSPSRNRSARPARPSRRLPSTPRTT